MKRMIYASLALFLAILACSVPSIPSPTNTPAVTEPPTSPPTEPPETTNLTCHELALLLDPALASSYDCQKVPASNEEFSVYPEHTLLTLHGYPLAGKFFEAKIAVYPLESYRLLQPDFVNERVASLQTFTTGAVTPTFSGSFGPSLPFLPVFNAAQVFFAQYQVLPFANGNGIRFLTEYAQYYAPVNNNDLFYTYQGLTSDGQYWISAILPINHPTLPADAVNPPNGMTWEEFSNNYEPYIADMINQLNSQPPDSFIPTLTALDALVSSIVIQP
jgi:hypothetical protein